MADENNTPENVTTDTENSEAPSVDSPTEVTHDEGGERESTSQLSVILGVLIVLLVLICGGLYLWGSALVNDAAVPTLENNTPEPRQIENNEPETPRAEADTQISETVSSSDSVEAIEADIESTIDLDTLDQEIADIEAEFDSALQEI